LKLSLDQLRAWFREAAPHLKIAIGIGALAPALRCHNILDLQWERDLDPDWTTITVSHHKRDEDGEPLVVSVTPQLRAILDIAWPHRRAAADAAHVSYVVHYRGDKIKSPKTARREAARRAGVPYGLAEGSTQGRSCGSYSTDEAAGRRCLQGSQAAGGDGHRARLRAAGRPHRSEAAPAH
jgi:integrase